MPYLGKTPSQATRQRYYKTASGGETSISGTMTTGGTLTFNDGEFVDVKLNGVSLVAGTDYNTTTANTIGGLSALAANDQVEIVVYDAFSVLSGDVDSNLSVGGNLSVTGTSALTGAATITTDDNNPQLTLTTTDADAGTGPTLDLFRDSASPADADVGGKISFTGKNDAAETLGMVIFQASHVDVSDGTEDAKLAISSRSAGSMVSRLNLDATETVFNEDSVDVDFRVESDNDTHALFVQGSDGSVGINTDSPTQPLTVSASGANGLFLLRDESDAADSCRLFFDSSNTRYALFAKDGVLSVRSGGTPGSSSGTERVQFTVNGINSSGVAGNTTVSSANLFISGGNNFQKSTSSRRYKTNITDATHGLSDVLNLRSVTYKGVNDGETVFGGLIAEEVHDAGLTEFVNYSQDDNGNDIPEGVHYGHMVALAFKAIQELKTELDAEKIKTAALTTRIETLEAGE